MFLLLCGLILLCLGMFLFGRLEVYNEGQPERISILFAAIIGTLMGSVLLGVGTKNVDAEHDKAAVCTYAGGLYRDGLCITPEESTSLEIEEECNDKWNQLYIDGECVRLEH